MPAITEVSMSHPSTHEIRLDAPFRLDLTVSALRRTSTNLVDVYTSDGQYLRALGGFANPVVVSVAQAASDRLVVTITGIEGGSTEIARVLATVRRMLGTEPDVSDFHRRAQAVPWLLPLAQRLRGLKPPRYPSLFEACANVILFQQISLHAATAIMRRMLLSIGARVEHGGVPLVVFPSAEQFLAADMAVIRRAGVSESKLGTLRRASEAIATGALSEMALSVLPSAEAALALQGIKGIGAWTAAVILLRGFGRLDVFPGGDSGVAANLARVTGERLNPGPVAELLGSQRGMLYFCLLLARLEESGEVGAASDVARRTSEREGSAFAPR
jgi:DNA-3-methyladenine glycosylase II